MSTKAPPPSFPEQINRELDQVNRYCFGSAQVSTAIVVYLIATGHNYHDWHVIFVLCVSACALGVAWASGQGIVHLLVKEAAFLNTRDEHGNAIAPYTYDPQLDVPKARRGCWFGIGLLLSSGVYANLSSYALPDGHSLFALSAEAFALGFTWLSGLSLRPLKRQAANPKGTQ